MCSISLRFLQLLHFTRESFVHPSTPKQALQYGPKLFRNKKGYCLRELPAFLLVASRSDRRLNDRRELAAPSDTSITVFRRMHLGQTANRHKVTKGITLIKICIIHLYQTAELTYVPKKHSRGSIRHQTKQRTAKWRQPRQPTPSAPRKQEQQLHSGPPRGGTHHPH